MLPILTVAAQTALLLVLLALGLSFYNWLTHPWRCDLDLDICWTYEGVPLYFQLVWVGWLVFVHRSDHGLWRGWSVQLHTD